MFHFQTNSYADFCAERTNPSPLQQQRHRDKKWEKGFERVPSKIRGGKEVAAFTRAHLYGVCGILITAGLTQKRELSDHWAIAPEHDYTRVRASMPRDLFMLFYSRFLHMAPVIGTVEKNDPTYDSKHHIRALEVALNQTWSALAEPGASLSYDEQMIKSTARASFFLMRFNKSKPIKHGTFSCSPDKGVMSSLGEVRRRTCIFFFCLGGLLFSQGTCEVEYRNERQSSVGDVCKGDGEELVAVPFVQVQQYIYDGVGDDCHTPYNVSCVCFVLNFCLFSFAFFSGIKGWSVCCPSGYCFVQYVDGGFLGDPDLRVHKDCPLGNTTRTVLHVLLKACPTFAGKIDGAGVTIAMDNYFTAAALLLCLASRDIFAVGTLRSNRVGLDGAMRLWKEAGQTVTQRGDIMMARSGSGIAIITWVDSQVVHLLTTKHLFKSDWTPVEYE